MKIKFVAIFLINITLFAQTGIVKAYYPNGNLRSEESWVKSVLDGTSFYYFENGNLKAEKTFSNGVLNGWLRLYYVNGLLREEFYIDNGVRDGVDKIYYTNGALEEIRFYKQGRLDKKIQLDFDKNFVAPTESYVGSMQQRINEKKNAIKCDADVCPVPIGGITEIEKKIVYPENAKLYNLEGRVLVAATIDTLGNVLQTAVIHGLGLGLDEEAERVVKATQFIPATKNKKKVQSNATIPLNFRMKPSEIIVAKNSVNDQYFPEIIEEKKEEKIDLTQDLTKNEPQIAENEVEIQQQNEVKPKVEVVHKTTKEKQILAQNEEKNVEPKVENVAQQEIIKSNEFINCSENTCAEPIGGYQKLLENFKIPKRVIEKKVTGEIIVIAEIDKNGDVKSTSIKTGLPHGANDAAEVAVLYTKFKPAIHNGIPVDSKTEIKFVIK